MRHRCTTAEMGGPAQRTERQGQGPSTGGPPPWLLAAAAGAGVAAGAGMALLIRARRRRSPARAFEAGADEIKADWPETTDEDLRRARGRAGRLAEAVRARTGEAAGRILGQIESLARPEEDLPERTD